MFYEKMYRIIVLVCFIAYCYTRLPSGYSDFYARHKLYFLSTIYMHYENVTGALNGCFNKYEWYGFVYQPCDMFEQNNTNITCSGFVMTSVDDEAIIITFMPTMSDSELIEEEIFYNMTLPFPGGGTVAKFWYNGFQIVWNAGIRDAFLSAKNKYPTYELWVTGGSMGGCLASNAAAYISQLGFMPPDQIKMVSFGQTRVGDAVFAQRYPTLVPYAYRVTHRHDIAPHLIPPKVPGEVGYMHFKNEIWYNNTMNEGDPYVQCVGEEDPNCSDSVAQSLWTWVDHKDYFNLTGYICMKKYDSSFS